MSATLQKLWTLYKGYCHNQLYLAFVFLGLLGVFRAEAVESQNGFECRGRAFRISEEICAGLKRLRIKPVQVESEVIFSSPLGLRCEDYYRLSSALKPPLLGAGSERGADGALDGKRVEEELRRYSAVTPDALSRVSAAVRISLPSNVADQLMRPSLLVVIFAGSVYELQIDELIRSSQQSSRRLVTPFFTARIGDLCEGDGLIGYIVEGAAALGTLSQADGLGRAFAFTVTPVALRRYVGVRSSLYRSRQTDLAR